MTTAFDHAQALYDAAEPDWTEEDEVMKQEYWQHDVSGDIFAVRMDDSGAVTGVHGPVHYADALNEHLDILDYDETDAEWIANEPTHLYDPSTR